MVSACDEFITLSWASPGNTGGSHILGYILEKRKKGSNLWSVVNATDELIKGAFSCVSSRFELMLFGEVGGDVVVVVSLHPEKTYAVKDVVAGLEYEFRVSAINLSGVGEFSSPSEFVFARDPKSEWSRLS